MASTTGLDLSVSGLASGVDWKALVTALANAERSPETQWKQQQTTIDQKNAAFGVIKNYLTTLQTDVQTLKDASLYANRSATTSDATIVSASAGSGATLGTYEFNISQFGSAARIAGTSNIAHALSVDGNLSSVTLGTAGFSTAVTAGTFSIDGHQITISTSDTLQSVFDQIASATGNTVTAGYSSGTDRITLTSSTNSEIVLGSATDTSNFLQVAKLYNTGQAGAVTSTSALGGVRLTAAMADSGLSTAITDGGSGAGAFTINGVSIAYNAGTDNIQNVIDRINSSTAGVTASYDSINDRFIVANQAAGDVGITMQDVTGNFLAVTGLSAGAFTHGKNLLYTVNGSPTLVSQSNTITETSSGIAGLSVTALKTGTVTVTVGSDTSTIKSAIQSFISDYNTLQSYISGQSATSTDSTGKVTAGLLTGDMDASRIASTFRSLSFSAVSATGLTSALDQLADLGIQSNGKDNTIKLSDSTALDNALRDNLTKVQSFFSDATNGFGVQLDTFLTSTIGDSGTLVNHQTTLSKQSTSIDDQITALEKTVTADTARWNSEFQTMEQVQAQVNQQLTYLTQQVTNWGKS